MRGAGPRRARLSDRAREDRGKPVARGGRGPGAWDPRVGRALCGSAAEGPRRRRNDLSL